MNGIKRNLVLPNGATIEWFIKDGSLFTLELSNSGKGLVAAFFLRKMILNKFSGEIDTQLCSSAGVVSNCVMCWRVMNPNSITPNQLTLCLKNLCLPLGGLTSLEGISSKDQREFEDTFLSGECLLQFKNTVGGFLEVIYATPSNTTRPCTAKEILWLATRNYDIWQRDIKNGESDD